MTRQALGDVVDVVAGQHIEASLYHFEPVGSPYLTGPADFGETYPRVTKWTNSPKVFAKSSDVLVTVKGAGVGKSNLACDAAIGRQLMALRPRQGKILQSFLFHFIRSNERLIARLADGATVPGIGKADLTDLKITLPSLDEQKRIAAILDKADQLRQKRRQAIALLDSLTQSIFLEMFGDPMSNPKGWPLMRVGDLAAKYSDGPFGSNLKSDHYVDQGIRVIRLQNIGIGEFIDSDRAYITEEHFKSLAKHECLPGDVLIGTLGDPNLRACIQPDWLPQALNKADCVQLRPNCKIALSEYCASLINQESTMSLAQGLVLGQTRGRISMGRLRELELPVAPLTLQIEFASIVKVYERRKRSIYESLQHLNLLFASLQHRAFSGQL